MMLFNQLGHHDGILRLFFIGQNECQTIEERYADFVHGCIERDSGHCQYRLSRMADGVCFYVGRMASQEVADTFVAEHNAFGPSRRAAGVDKIGKIVGGAVCCDSIATYSTVEERFHVNGLVSGNGVETVFGCDDIAGFAIFQDIFHAVSGIFRIARDVGGSGFQDTEE